MKKLISVLMFFCLVGLPAQTFAAEGEQTVTVRTTINAAKATELEELIEKEKEKPREKNDYTEESWNKYQTALKEAEDVLKNSPYDEEKVNAALAKLQQAIKGLVLKKSAGSAGGGTSTNSGATGRTISAASGSTAGTTAKSYPKTGMAAGIGLAGVGVFLAAGTVISWKRRR